MFLFDNKVLGYARQSRIGITTYGRKVRTPNEHGTCEDIINVGERKLMESATENNRLSSCLA